MNPNEEKYPISSAEKRSLYKIFRDKVLRPGDCPSISRAMETESKALCKLHAPLIKRYEELKKERDAVDKKMEKLGISYSSYEGKYRIVGDPYRKRYNKLELELRAKISELEIKMACVRYPSDAQKILEDLDKLLS